MHKVFFTQSVGRDSAHSERPKAPPVKQRMQVPQPRLPRWMKISAKFGPNYARVKGLMDELGLHTVCREAACPNIRECWDEGTATFMILGKHCTRDCHFCDVLHGSPDGIVDEREPERLAQAVSALGLKQIVITSVTRDDLPDGGASMFARTIELLRRQDNSVRIELLIPDFRGNFEALKTVLDARPDVLGHNVETVGRLHKRVRPAARLDRSLEVLRFMSEYDTRPIVKSGLMVGLGERTEEIVELIHQTVAAGVDILTIGQYLRPSEAHLPVERFYHPDEFAELARIGRDIGLSHVESGPLVRSSYRAFTQSQQLLEQAC